MVAFVDINMDSQSYDEIRIYNSRYLKNIYKYYNLIVQDDNYIPDYNYVICNKCCYDIAYIQSRSHQEIKGASYNGLLDEYWHCQHYKIFFSNDITTPQYRTIGNGPSWFDVMMDEQKIMKDIKKANKNTNNDAIEDPQDSSDEEINSILKDFENKINDPRYKKEEDMKKYFNNQIDKKRFAGKKWIKELEKPCKYALRAFANESIATYKFTNPKTGKKDKLRFAECWQWECTGPITGKVYDLHICNCVHPGEKDDKGRLIWRDEWLCDPKFVFVYDRLEDWYKWDYSFTDSRWIYNAEKENCPLTNRKKDIIPGSGDCSTGFTKSSSTDGHKDGHKGARDSGRSSPTSATIMANVWSRNSRNNKLTDDDGWSTPLGKNK